MYTCIIVPYFYGMRVLVGTLVNVRLFLRFHLNKITRTKKTQVSVREKESRQKKKCYLYKRQNLCTPFIFIIYVISFLICISI